MTLLREILNLNEESTTHRLKRQLKAKRGKLYGPSNEQKLNQIVFNAFKLSKTDDQSQETYTADVTGYKDLLYLDVTLVPNDCISFTYEHKGDYGGYSQFTVEYSDKNAVNELNRIIHYLKTHKF